MAYFNDRVEAGKLLTKALAAFKEKKAIVLAIPRGGVVVGFEIASELGLLLDVIIPRKIGAPENPELAIGAVAEDGTIILDKSLVAYLGVPESFIREESERQREEIKRRLKVYRPCESSPNVKGLDVILVDDGIATGSTMKAALASVKNQGAKTVTVAVPVAPPSTIEELKKLSDKVICLKTPEYFQAIGQFYLDFSQTSDEEVIELLRLSRQKTQEKSAGVMTL